jgi:hypothetical protein
MKPMATADLTVIGLGRSDPSDDKVRSVQDRLR